MDWPTAFVIGVIVAIIAMRFRIFDYFNISKESGIDFSRTNHDIEFLNTISIAVDEIDNNCRYQCWHFVVDNPPEFLDQAQQTFATQQFMEAISFNHVMRAVSNSGYEEYLKTKKDVVMSRHKGVAGRKQFEKYVETVVGQMIHYSKMSSNKKIILYRKHVNRKDLSAACLAVLQSKLDKNLKYVDIKVT